MSATMQVFYGHRRIKRITSYAGHSRYLATISEPVGAIPRDRTIPSPYAYASTHLVFRDERGRLVFIVETKHKTYDVFECFGQEVNPWIPA